VKGIAGDGSGFFQGDAPGVEREGDGKGAAGDSITLTLRSCGDGLDGVACCEAGLGIFSTIFKPFSRLLDL
jgi:hypothetical protein